ncbi:MAG: PepSY domain-containing protein [Gammaproteobacteria bacterium]|nr:PepSY domain-containing protein [Gammaproteobacteria bacterium]
MTRRKPKRYVAFHWHRRIGLLALVLVVVLAVTGIMLNHTGQLGLDERYVQSSMVLDWYGLEPEGEPQTYRVKGHSISQWQQSIYFDGRLISSSEQELRGVVTVEPLIVAAFESELLLLSEQGELVERLATGFDGISRIGRHHGQAVLATDAGYYRADENIIDWTKISAEGVTWSEPVSLSETEREALRQAYRGEGLSMERVILDLHSGRLFGAYGVYVMDAAAIALLWLAFSGLWVWWKRKDKQKKKRHYRKHHLVRSRR